MPDLSGVTTNFFPSAKEGFTTTLNGTISSGATTVVLNSISGYTNGAVVVLVVDPTDSTKKQAFTGVVDTAGVQITGVVWTEGTNQTHTTGSTVVDYWTATHMSMVTKGILISHNQNGTLKSTAAYSPGGTDVALADGGTNASLTASNGGIFYSTASAGAILSGTATANKALMSGASGAPTWSTPTFPNASATSRKIVVSDGTNWIASTETYATPGTTGNVLTSDGTNWTSAASTAGNLTLLKGDSGTHSTNAATNVSTVAISGLTALDTLIVEVTFSPVTTAVAGSALYSTTDSTALQSLYQGGASVAAGKTYSGTITIRKDPTATTIYTSKEISDIATSAGGSSAGIGGLVTATGMATNWTGSWTLALRLGATTNTCPWSWAVHRKAGQ